MRACKICECGAILYYSPPDEECPDPCPQCGRMTLGYEPFEESDPRIEIERKKILEKKSVNRGGETSSEDPYGTNETVVLPTPDSPIPPGFGTPPGFQNVVQNQMPPSFQTPVQNQTPPSFQTPVQNQTPPGFQNVVQNQTPLGFQNVVQNQTPPGFQNAVQNQTPPEMPSWKRAAVSTPEKIITYRLRSIKKGYVIELPDEDCIVGRIEVGGEQLADNNAVSRKHIKVQINKRQKGIFVTDISQYGTKINGNPIIKNTKTILLVGQRITLYNEDLVLEQGEE